VCRDRFPGIEGVEVNERGDAGGEVGKGSLGEVRCRDGIESK
jgi:hypothetical protein